MSEDVYLMVIAPHPDDSEFGIAGTVAGLTKEGKKVVYVICTNGDKGTSDRTINQADLVAIRHREQQAAADVLGVSEVVFLDYPDQGIEDTPEFRKELVRLIRKYKPEVVASCDPYRKYMWHRDHRITGQVVADAVAIGQFSKLPDEIRPVQIGTDRIAHRNPAAAFHSIHDKRIILGAEQKPLVAEQGKIGGRRN